MSLEINHLRDYEAWLKQDIQQRKKALNGVTEVTNEKGPKRQRLQRGEDATEASTASGSVSREAKNERVYFDRVVVPSRERLPTPRSMGDDKFVIVSSHSNSSDDLHEAHSPHSSFHDSPAHAHEAGDEDPKHPWPSKLHSSKLPMAAEAAEEEVVRSFGPVGKVEISYSAQAATTYFYPQNAHECDQRQRQGQIF